MARATFVKKAQKNIYENGKRVEYVSEKGKRKGQTLTKIDRTIPADKNDKVVIAVGESYWWWQFQYRPKQYSKTQPSRSQLTQSGFLSSLYSIEDRISEVSYFDSKDDFDAFKDDIMGEIESLKDECQSSLDNMPESLQSAPTGELLQERIDALDSWHSEIDSIECDVDEDSIREEIISENEDAEGDDKLDEEQIEEAVREKVREEISNSIDQLQGASSGL